MRKIGEAMCEAVKNRKNWECGNTRVQVRDGGNWVKVFLHDNLIYIECEESGLKQWTFAGWPTKTTKSRLRALGVDYTKQEHDDTAWYDV